MNMVLQQSLRPVKKWLLIL